MPDTEVEAAAELAAQPESFSVTPGDVETVLAPPGWSVTTHDHEKLAPTPRRSHGVVTVRDAEGFMLAVQQRQTGPVSVYADEATAGVIYDERSVTPRRSVPSLVAVLNDDQGGTPGWRDHIVCLELERTPEWLHWLSRDGRLSPQHDFARHVEDGLREIVAPSPADMLDMAQSFQAITNAKFRGGQRLKTGERQFTYDEEVTAKAGAESQITIPDEFTLEVAPFYGAEPARVRAAFRFQLRQAELTLGYKLDRPHEVERAAFRAIMSAVSEQMGVAIIAGVAPTPRTALPTF